MDKLQDDEAAREAWEKEARAKWEEERAEAEDDDWEAYAEARRDDWEEREREFWEAARLEAEDDDWEAVADDLWEKHCEETADADQT